MQSLHVYDYFCYRKWNLEGNFAGELIYYYPRRPEAQLGKSLMLIE